jgi:iron complex outermembrane recepter protein
MARLRILVLRTLVATVAALVAVPAALAQAPSSSLAPVQVYGRATPAVLVGGWGDVPLGRMPLQASVFSAEMIKESGAQRLSDLVNFDPAVGDAYNSEGYWDFLSVRGFVLDNRFNYRRDGLPINAETSIPLDNKARIEILKGITGMQSGTSAPGGLVNFVVKRPLEEPVRRAGLEWRERGSVTASADLSQRFGIDNAVGARFNAALAHLDPMLRSAKGERRLVALAGDWRLGADTLLEAEVESSHRSQPSQPGFSLLGNSVPAPGDPRINLNNQPWSLPVVFDGDTASLRLQHRIAEGWRVAAHAASQRLRSDDRVAFPFGCTATDGTYYPDRYCPDGTFDLYDFRSENERRRVDALELSLQGQFRTGPFGHAVGLGGMQSRVKNRFQRQAFNFAGTGSVDASLVTAAAPALTDENTNRDERSTELNLRDAISVDEQLTLWLGLRHTRLHRESVRTDGSRPTDYHQSFTTPFAAVSYAFAPEQLVYASWGRGVESEVAPNRSRYVNAGEVLPALKSRQWEVGVKGADDLFEWGLAGFEIVRPLFADIGTCDADLTCERRVDGVARHRGIDANAAFRSGAWLLRGGLQWLHARRAGSRLAANNGLLPTNVPATTLRLQASHTFAEVPGLAVQSSLVREGRRMVTPDNSANIPSYTRVDAGLSHQSGADSLRLTWRLGIDNLVDRRAWKESPYQFSHAYLFPLAPRTWRASVQVDL